MGGGDPSRDIKVLDLLGGQFEVNSVLTFILSRYWIGESIANSSQQWCANQFVRIDPEMSVDNR
jgi:hypothetical protein